VQHARLYTLPESPPPIPVAGVDELYIHQIGGPGGDFFGAYAKEVLRRVPG
jgi:hypothetical protein